MRIGGFQSFSLNEFPGRIAAVVFCQGCNFRCPYCHNPELVDPARYSQPWPEKRVMDELAARRGRLQGVAISGGEPVLQEDLEAFIRKVHGLGFAVKLHTNGSDPDTLARLLEAGLLDYVGLDVKAPPAAYPTLTRSQVSPQTITRSISTVLSSGVDHEFRTTWAPSLLSKNDILEIAGMVRGCRSWIIQRFVPSKPLDPAFLVEKPPDEATLEEVRSAVEAMGIACQVR
jgi:pyruvate formate lyase activating enzyme